MLGISGMDLLVLAGLALVIFGPERLPTMAADAGRFVRRVRGHVESARADLTEHLPPEFAGLSNVRPQDLTPRAMLRRVIDPEEFSLHDPGPAPAAEFAVAIPSRPLAAGEIPPHDPDAT